MPRKPKTTQSESLNEVQGRDLFQTPNYATELLVPFISKHIKYIWEPACGDNKISNVLEEHGFTVISTDLKYGANFLDDPCPFDDLLKPETMIITNPPYSLKKKFYQRCVEHGVSFALLLPADYCGWVISALRDGAEKIIPDKRIDYITPSGKSGKTGNTSYYHSLWFTRGLNLNKTETFVTLTNEMKENI